MILLDVNVVVAAHRDDHPHHGTVEQGCTLASFDPDFARFPTLR